MNKRVSPYVDLAAKGKTDGNPDELSEPDEDLPGFVVDDETVDYETEVSSCEEEEDELTDPPHPPPPPPRRAHKRLRRDRDSLAKEIYLLLGLARDEDVDWILQKVLADDVARRGRRT